MKIVVASSTLIPSPPPPHSYGGLEVVASLRARYFAERGHEVYMLCARGSRVSWSLRWGGPPPNIHFVEEAREEDYLKHVEEIGDADLIVDDSWEGRVAERFPEKAVKVWHWSYPPHAFRLRGRVRSFAVSKAHADLLERTMGVDEAGYVYNAVDVDEYPLAARDKKDYIVYLNRVDREKGAHLFVKLCRELNVRGVMMGEDYVVADREYVHELLRSLPPNVEYLGRVPHRVKVEVLQRARCLVAPLAPFYFEVFGLYAVEASLTGTPVVAFRNGALPEIVEQGVNGVLVDSYSDMLSTVSAIVSGSLDMDPSKCRAKGLKFSYKNWRLEEVFGL